MITAVLFLVSYLMQVQITYSLGIAIKAIDFAPDDRMRPNARIRSKYKCY